MLKNVSSRRLLNLKNVAPPSQRTTSQSTSNRTENASNDTRIRNKDPLINSRPTKTFSHLFVEDKIGQINRLSKKVRSRDMITSHHQSVEAMKNSLSDTGVGLPIHDASSKPTGFHTHNHAKPQTAMRWQKATSLINRLVKLPQSLRR